MATLANPQNLTAVQALQDWRSHQTRLSVHGIKLRRRLPRVGWTLVALFIVAAFVQPITLTITLAEIALTLLVVTMLVVLAYVIPDRLTTRYLDRQLDELYEQGEIFNISGAMMRIWDHSIREAGLRWNDPLANMANHHELFASLREEDRQLCAWQNRDLEPEPVAHVVGELNLSRQLNTRFKEALGTIDTGTKTTSAP
jgi:hypothetical protein